jgi:hypothetical protein
VRELETFLCFNTKCGKFLERAYFGLLRYVKHYWDAIEKFVTIKSIIQYMAGVWGKQRGGGV